MSGSISSHWEKAYRLPLSDIPWEIETPPADLVGLLKSGLIAPGTALDVACGSGNYSLYLAKAGFDMTSVDVSETALKIAKEKARKAGLEAGIHFIHADARHLADALPSTRFDLVLDWSFLHHIAPKDFAAYCGQFSALLKPSGVLLLACFSDADAPKRGLKQAVGKLGNVMYYRTREEIEAAYRPLHVTQYRACRLGKKKQHAGHCVLFQK